MSKLKRMNTMKLFERKYEQEQMIRLKLGKVNRKV